MPINTHFAVKGRDGITRESSLVTSLLYELDSLYAQGAITDKRLTALSRQLIAANTVGKLNSVTRAVAALGTKSNPRNGTIKMSSPRTTEAYARLLVAEAGAQRGQAMADWQRDATASDVRKGWLPHFGPLPAWAKPARRTRRKNPTYVRAPSVAALQKLPAASHRSTSPLSKVNATELKALMEAGKPKTALNRYNEMSNSNGVEYIAGTDGGLYYVNHGDPYDTTLIYDTGKDAVKVGAWGDIVERDRRFRDS